MFVLEMELLNKWILQIWILHFCMGVVFMQWSWNQFQVESITSASDYKRLFKSCPWENTNLDVEGQYSTVSFDEFRFTKQSCVKIVDMFNSPILSSMFLARDLFSMTFEDLQRHPNCYQWKTEVDTFDDDNEASNSNRSYIANCLRATKGTWLQLLDLSGNKFQKIHSNSFAKISKCLNYLILKHNQINIIESLAFNELNDLTYLDLSHNNLTAFDFNLIKTSHLEYLNLTSNVLSSISNYEINNNLISLKLPNNLLKTFEIFEMLKLTYLDLSQNELTDVKINNVPKLATLNLSHNKLKHFACIESLKELNLSHNQIANLSCTKVQYLTSLDLSHNKISKLSSKIFNYLPHLETFDLSHNNLNLISNMFNELKSVTTLSLQNNHLSVLPPNIFRGLDNLQRLDLSQNYIHKLQFGSFSGIKFLRKLDLSYNKIADLDFDKLIDLRYLRELIIDGNNCTLELADLHFKLPALSSLSLGHIPWKCNDLVHLTIALRKLNIETISKIHNGDFKSAVNGIACYSGETEPQILTYESIAHIDVDNIDALEDFENLTVGPSSTISSMLTSSMVNKNINTNETGPLLQLFKQAIKDIVEMETIKIRSDLTEQIRNSTWTIIQKIDNSMTPKVHTKLLINKDSEPIYADYVFDEIA